MLPVRRVVPEAIGELRQDTPEGLSILQNPDGLAEGRGGGRKVFPPMGHIRMGLHAEGDLLACLSEHGLEGLWAGHLVVGVIDF